MNRVIYHIFPLGACGCPHDNDFISPAVPALDGLYDWPSHLLSLGCSTLFLGPVFESSSHGYDTADYFTVDRRLGTNHTLTQFSRVLHENELRLILDGVFNHVGRDFWARICAIG